MSGQKGKVHLGPNVSSSAHYSGCVVNGSNMSIIIIINNLIYYNNYSINRCKNKHQNNSQL